MAHVGCPWPPAGLGGRNERLDQAILIIAQSLAGPKVADPGAIRGRPHSGLQTGKVPGAPSARHRSPVKLTSAPFQNGLLAILLSVDERAAMAERVSVTAGSTLISVPVWPRSTGKALVTRQPSS